MTSDEGRLFSRASALGLIGGAAGLFAGLGGTAGASTACAQTPEGEIGPYFADDRIAGFHRGNVLANLDGTGTQRGVPLALTVQVYDTGASCAPMAGVQVDLWHCNASGVYSDEPTLGTASETWLRGYQLTGAAGTVAFRTIVPGWYRGRATHIHLRVRSKYNAASSGGDGSNTTQVFFPQAIVDAISTTVAPYRARGVNPTTNAADHVYASQTRGTMELALTGNPTAGYAASVAIGLPIA